MDFEADCEIPGDQEGSGLQSVGCREGWWGKNLGNFQERFKTHWYLLIVSMGPYALY